MVSSASKMVFVFQLVRTLGMVQGVRAMSQRIRQHQVSDLLMVWWSTVWGRDVTPSV
jgi:hypothetical protein